MNNRGWNMRRRASRRRMNCYLPQFARSRSHPGRAQPAGRLIWRLRANHWRGIANAAQAHLLSRVASCGAPSSAAYRPEDDEAMARYEVHKLTFDAVGLYAVIDNSRTWLQIICRHETLEQAKCKAHELNNIVGQ
jgi:hypothetical protein